MAASLRPWHGPGVFPGRPDASVGAPGGHCFPKTMLTVLGRWEGRVELMNEGQIDRFTLVGKTLRMVGFGFGPHPMEAGAYIHAVLYRQTRRSFVLCLSDVARPDVDMARSGLGCEVDGGLIAQFAVRHLEGRLKVVRPALESISVVWEWAKS